MSIPEIASQLVEQSSLCLKNQTNCRTIVFVGSKKVGKSTLLYTFLDKTDVPKETLVLEYSFGRKTNQKEGIEKSICHVWEYGGKLDVLKNIMPLIPIQGKLYYSIMIDLSKIKSLWINLEICLKTMMETYADHDPKPEVILIGGKYDLFKNYDSEVKKAICTTLRAVALLNNAHLIFYSSKDPQLSRRAKDMCHNIGFGSGIPFKEKSSHYLKPLLLPKCVDSWESIGSPPSTFEQIKIQHTSRFPPQIDAVTDVMINPEPQQTFPEPFIFSLCELKYKEMLALETLDETTHDYILNNLQ